MDRIEVLRYLELDDSASLPEIQARSQEKIRQLEDKSEDMPSDFLKKMHQKNIQKANSVRNEVMQWRDEPQVVLPAITDAVVAGSPDSIPQEEIVSRQEPPDLQDSVFLTTGPVIIGSKSKLPLNANAQAKEPLGWLVRHTEKQTAITFTIFPGKNYLGRKKQEGLSHFIVIDDDVFISRVHAVIEAEESGGYEFYISDNELSNLGKPSKNGTYINGNDKRISQKTRLSENDHIQVGLTKLILKINRDNNLKKIIKEVQGSKFMDTVIIDSE